MTAYQDDVPILDFAQTTRTSRILKIKVVNPDGSPKDLTGATAAFRLGTAETADAIEKTELDGISFTDPGEVGYVNQVEVAIGELDWDGLAGEYSHETHVTDNKGDRGLVLQGSCRVTRSLFEPPPA